MNLKQKAMQEKLAAIKQANQKNPHEAGKTAATNKAAKPAGHTLPRNLPRRGNI